MPHPHLPFARPVRAFAAVSARFQARDVDLGAAERSFGVPRGGLRHDGAHVPWTWDVRRCMSQKAGGVFMLTLVGSMFEGSVFFCVVLFSGSFCCSASVLLHLLALWTQFLGIWTFIQAKDEPTSHAIHMCF